jgi:predicted glycosyltransferase involved in capsule biosynthesis
MYQIDKQVWVILHTFDTPKEVTIIDIKQTHCNVAGTLIWYIVKYKNREFEIRNVDVYPDKKTADIFWSILILQDYDSTLEIPDLFATDDYEIAALKAKKLLSSYMDTDPDILLKYL